LERSSAAAALALSLVAGLTISGCSSVAPTREEQAASAIADSLMVPDASGLTFEREQAECVGNGFVDHIGVDKLLKLGLVTEGSDEMRAKGPDEVNFPPGAAKSAARVAADCLDLAGYVIASLERAAEESGERVSERSTSCVRDVVTFERVRAYYELAFTNRTKQASAQLESALRRCLAS
jgi:hypothetical protein